MPIFQIKNKKVSQVSSNLNYFSGEAELRDFFAENLEDLLGMRFLVKEYPVLDGKGRIDTLAIDETNAPVIIEYKWGQNDAILPQGQAYFNWLKKNKKHFDLLVSDKLGKEVKVNWSSPRVVLVSQGFDDRTKIAVEEVDYVDLITYTPYSQDILYLETVYSPNKKQVLKERVETQAEEVFNNDYHFNLTSPEMKKIAQELRSKILELPSVEEKSGQKTGITYKTTKSFVRFEFRKSWIQLLLRNPDYPEDTEKIVKDITSNEWGYLGMIKLTSDSDIDYVFSLVKASYNSTL